MKNIVPLTLLINLFIISNCSIGQGNLYSASEFYPNNSIYIELAGNSLFFASLNYERIFHKEDNLFLSVRGGIGYGKFLNVSVLSLPILVNGIFHIHRAFSFELGLGTTLMNVGYQKDEDYPYGYHFGGTFTGVAGIRIQSSKGFLFRASFTPILDVNNLLSPDSKLKSRLLPWFGISFGDSF